MSRPLIGLGGWMIMQKEQPAAGVLKKTVTTRAIAAAVKASTETDFDSWNGLHYS